MSDFGRIVSPGGEMGEDMEEDCVFTSVDSQAGTLITACVLDAFLSVVRERVGLPVSDGWF